MVVVRPEVECGGGAVEPRKWVEQIDLRLSGEFITVLFSSKVMAADSFWPIS